MGHKTLIDGTIYEISGGKTLIDGTTYSIKNGKTLVDGTAYEVGFVKLATITITGFGEGITINDTGYMSASTLAVPIGTVVTCKAHSDNGDNIDPSYGYYDTYGNIHLNGNRVGNYTFSGSSADCTYNHIVTKNVTINNTYAKGQNNITITEA